MFTSRIYTTTQVFLVCGIFLRFADAKSIAQHAEKKDIQKPVDQLNHNDESDKFHNNFHKRQIAPEFNQFQQQQQFDQQYFQQPFIPGNQSPFGDGQQFFNQLPNQAAQDEETRFFLSQQTTTLNPLSFGNDPPSTTLDPVQQQLAEQQRRFQQEIADQGLREQQEKSFGVPRPQTTTPPPAPQPGGNQFFQQFDPQGQGQFFYGDPTASSQLSQNNLAFGSAADFNQQQQSFYPTFNS